MRLTGNMIERKWRLSIRKTRGGRSRRIYQEFCKVRILFATFAEVNSSKSSKARFLLCQQQLPGQAPNGCRATVCADVGSDGWPSIEWGENILLRTTVIILLFY